LVARELVATLRNATANTATNIGCDGSRVRLLETLRFPTDQRTALEPGFQPSRACEILFNTLVLGDNLSYHAKWNPWVIVVEVLIHCNTHAGVESREEALITLEPIGLTSVTNVAGVRAGLWDHASCCGIEPLDHQTTTILQLVSQETKAEDGPLLHYLSAFL